MCNPIAQALLFNEEETELKLSAASRGESPILKEQYHFTIRSLTPQQATGNALATEFNVMIGLCVGHDSLFLKYAFAPGTVFAVKDRLLGHNPLAAIYTIDSYYRSIKFAPKPE